MKPVWIVVANAYQAQLFERAKPRGALEPLVSFVHPESRLKTGELTDGHPGRVQLDRGGQTSYQPQTEPKDKEQERFARQIADYLGQGVHAERCGGVMLFASHRMLGAIRELLDQKTTKVVQHSAAIDLTGMQPRELETRIAQQLAL